MSLTTRSERVAEADPSRTDTSSHTEDPMTASARLERRVFVPNSTVPKAKLPDGRVLRELKRILIRLQESVALDLVDDALDAVLGDQVPTTDEVAPVTLRLRRALPQLVMILRGHSTGTPCGNEVIAALKGSEDVLLVDPPVGSALALGCVRWLARATEAVLGLLAGDST